MFLLLLILATVSLSSMNEFTWDKLRRSYIYHDLALPLKTMNDKARRSLRRGCSSRWPWTFQGWTMSSEQWTWTWGLSASLSSWTGDEVALGADVIRQMWKATDPILEKLSCEGTRMTATGGQSISRSGENNRRRHWTSLWFRSHWSNAFERTPYQSWQTVARWVGWEQVSLLSGRSTRFQNIKSAAGDILHRRLSDLRRTGT